MTMINISHIAIGVRDINTSLPFWTDVVGLHVTLDAEVEQISLGGKTVRRRGVYLRGEEGPDSTFIVLDESLTDPYTGEPKALFEIGVHHFSFWVHNIDEILERARAAALEIVRE